MYHFYWTFHFPDLLNMKKYRDRAAFDLFADSFNIWDLNGGKESTPCPTACPRNELQKYRWKSSSYLPWTLLGIVDEVHNVDESRIYTFQHKESLISQSTYIYRAPQFMSLRWNWDSPTPLAASERALPPGPKGGGAHSPAAKGVGESQFQRLKKRLALCLLCAASRTKSSCRRSKQNLPRL